MKVKCLPQLAGSEGYIGPVWFDKDGVSEEVPAEVARRFLGIFGGELVSELPEGAKTLDQAIAIERRQAEHDLAKQEAERRRFRVDLEDVAPVQASVSDAAPGEYTRESLSALADKSGIKPLREIGDKFGVKGQSIAKLIDDIIEAQVKQRIEG